MKRPLTQGERLIMRAISLSVQQSRTTHWGQGADKARRALRAKVQRAVNAAKCYMRKAEFNQRDE